MVDLNVTIKDLIKDLVGGRVQLQFPQTSQKFPLISLFGVNDKSHLILDNVERLSYVTYQIDIWDSSKNGNTRAQCEQLAIATNARMLAQGWKRDNAVPLEDPSGLHRKMMQFSGYVDNVTGKIYPNSNF